MEDGSCWPHSGDRERSVENRVLEAVRAALRCADGRPLKEVAELYLADLASRCGASHAHKSRKQIERVLAACPGPTVAEAFAFRAQRLRDGRSRRTVEMEIAAVRAMFAWARRGRLVGDDPLEELPPLAIRQGDLARRPRAFTAPELARYFAAAARRDKRHGGAPQAPNWRLLSCCGFRWGEAARLTDENLSGDLLSVAAKSAKARRARVVVLPEDLAEFFDALRGPLLLAPNGGSWLSASHSTIHRLFRRTLDEAGLDRHDANGRLLTIHSFRRTAVTSWTKKGVPLHFVSLLAGHATTAFTEKHYLDTKADDAVRAMRRVLRAEKKQAATEKRSPPEDAPRD